MTAGRLTALNLALLLVAAGLLPLSACRRDEQANPPMNTPLFPWPPPAASATEVVPLLKQHTRPRSLGDASEILVAAFDANGYVEKSFYGLPNGYGFAVVTRLEQIESDGRSKLPPERWSADPPHVFTLKDYIRALFTANPGYYRVIVFIVTDQPFTQSAETPEAEQVTRWLTGGLNILPSGIARLSYTTGTACTALIYEFEKSAGKQPQALAPSSLDARGHLIKSGLWKWLGE